MQNVRSGGRLVFVSFFSRTIAVTGLHIQASSVAVATDEINRQIASLQEKIRKTVGAISTIDG